MFPINFRWSVRGKDGPDCVLKSLNRSYRAVTLNVQRVREINCTAWVVDEASDHATSNVRRCEGQGRTAAVWWPRSAFSPRHPRTSDFRIRAAAASAFGADAWATRRAVHKAVRSILKMRETIASHEKTIKELVSYAELFDHSFLLIMQRTRFPVKNCQRTAIGVPIREKKNE